jgi:O-antigen/teichoic acid export membrane protein
MSTLKSLSDRAGFLIAANIVKFAIGIFMPMILVRMLSHADYGSYQQMVLIGNAALALLVLGLPTSVFYFNSHVGRDRVPTLVLQTSLLLLAGGAVAAVGVCLGAAPIARALNNPGMAWLLSLYAISTGFVIASEHSISFLIAQNRYVLSVAFEVGEALVRIVLLVTPLWLGYGFSGLIVCIVIYSILRFVGRSLYLFLGSGLDYAHRDKRWFIGEQLNYSIPIAMTSLVAMLGSTFNRGILAHTFTPADYAIYAVGNVVLPFATIFQSAVANVLRAEMPLLVRDGKLTEAVRIVRESVRKLSIIVLPAFIFLLAHSYQFITVLFTNSYAESVGVFRICVWELPLDTLILSAIPQIFGKTRANMYINFAGTAFLLVCSFTLIKTIGFYGAALAGILTQYFIVTLFMVVVLRLMRTSLVRLLPLPELLKVVVAAGIGALVSRLVPEVSSVGLVTLVADGGVFAVVFFGAAVLLGVFTATDRQLARRWLAKVLPLRPIGELK